VDVIIANIVHITIVITAIVNDNVTAASSDEVKVL
jgi:hypothetical protein